MAGTPRKIAAGQLAYFCDECGRVVIGDTGYLTVLNRSGGKRWAVVHDGCRMSQAHHAALADQRRIIVRLSRVATYPLMLTTMASLAAEVIGFETTNWWTFLMRVVSDTEWHRDEGTKTNRNLYAENKEKVNMAFGYER